MARDEELGREVALETHALAGGRQSAAGPPFPVRGGNHRPARSSRRRAHLRPGPRCLRAAVLCHALHSRRNVAAGHRAIPPRLPARQGAGRRAIAFQKLIRSFLAVCQTIGYAHSQGVIHRDLKPANIMLGHYGETLVVDWGLAKRLPKPVDAARRDARYGQGRRDHGHRPDDAGPDQGFAGLHEPRAGRRPHRSDRSPQRHLRPGGHALHDPCRQAALCRHGAPPIAGPREARRFSPSQPGPRRRSPGLGSHLPEGHEASSRPTAMPRPWNWPPTWSTGWPTTPCPPGGSRGRRAPTAG